MEIHLHYLRSPFGMVPKHMDNSDFFTFLWHHKYILIILVSPTVLDASNVVIVNSNSVQSLNMCPLISVSFCPLQSEDLRWTDYIFLQPYEASEGFPKARS
jgi:hypothetical protein